jgi:hypothetical protein
MRLRNRSRRVVTNFKWPPVWVVGWTLAWLAAVVLLIVYWRSLPTYVAWSIAIAEVILVPDLKVIRGSIQKAQPGEND